MLIGPLVFCLHHRSRQNTVVLPVRTTINVGSRLCSFPASPARVTRLWSEQCTWSSRVRRCRPVIGILTDGRFRRRAAAPERHRPPWSWLRTSHALARSTNSIDVCARSSRARRYRSRRRRRHRRWATRCTRGAPAVKGGQGRAWSWPHVFVTVGMDRVGEKSFGAEKWWEKFWRRKMILFFSEMIKSAVSCWIHN
jgi:hypothetical protein